MNTRAVLLTATLACCALGATGSCSSPPTESKSPAATAAGTDSVVAEVHGKTLTLGELDATIANELFQARADAVDRWVNDQILEQEAERRGIEVGKVLETVATEAGPVPDAEINRFFEENKNRMPPDATLETMGPQIRQFLTQQRAGQVLDRLREAANATINLDPPRVEVAATGASKGPADAPITIVEFSDYQCPFCSRAEPTIQAVLERYPEQVRFVYRHFPLDSIHPRARAAAEAANCAGKQDQFWGFHDLIFANPRNLEDTDLRSYAETVGLDLGAYDTCRQDPAVAAAVQQDMDDGQKAGTTGTPAFYVNGLMLSGARPVEDFVEIIESELERLGSSS